MSLRLAWYTRASSRTSTKATQRSLILKSKYKNKKQNKTSQIGFIFTMALLRSNTNLSYLLIILKASCSLHADRILKCIYSVYYFVDQKVTKSKDQDLKCVNPG